MITALIDQGDVDEANSSNLDYVGKAIAAAARRGLDLTYTLGYLGICEGGIWVWSHC